MTPKLKPHLKSMALSATLTLAILGIPQTGHAQNLFETDQGSGNIYEFTPSGTMTTFATGLGYPPGLAFDSSGDLFEPDQGSGNIYKFTPSGTQSTFATGLGPIALAIDSSGDVYEADHASNSIFEFTPSGTKTTFATGLSYPRAELVK